MLTVSELSVGYGRAQVIFDLSLRVESGRVLALLGRNGAGKSTTLKAIMGLIGKRGGRVSLLDRDITDLPAHEIARLGLGYVPEERRIFTGLTVAENLEVGQRPAAAGTSGWTAQKLFALFPNLAELQDRSARRISGGEQQMLAVARTLMGNPRLLLLDEPSEGLAPIIVQQIVAALGSLKRHGLTVVLSEQNLRFANALADDAVVLERGRVVFRGTMAALSQDADLSQRYLAP